jgi:hypothetical protein
MKTTTIITVRIIDEDGDSGQAELKITGSQEQSVGVAKWGNLSAIIAEAKEDYKNNKAS